FIPMIQVLLTREMTNMGLTVVYNNPYHHSNLNKVKADILSNPAILNFLKESLNPNLSENRRQSLLDYIDHHLQANREAS
ncbi:MAG: hypothetical protein HRT44_09255, partial [Bdellovibrionales bacterium]|nr:hypothetical protein [Bdellovibrionales bacterium]NQZ19426.1 hypothetical protein [Bdellovibrionales bacterium]